MELGFCLAPTTDGLFWSFSSPGAVRRLRLSHAFQSLPGVVDGINVESTGPRCPWGSESLALRHSSTLPSSPAKLGWRGPDHRGHGSPRARSPAHQLYRAGLEGELLPGGDCLLHRPGFRLGADAVEGGAASRVAGTPSPADCLASGRHGLPSLNPETPSQSCQWSFRRATGSWTRPANGKS